MCSGIPVRSVFAVLHDVSDQIEVLVFFMSLV